MIVRYYFGILGRFHSLTGYYPVADKGTLLRNVWYKFVAREVLRLNMERMADVFDVARK